MALFFLVLVFKGVFHMFQMKGFVFLLGFVWTKKEIQRQLETFRNSSDHRNQVSYSLAVTHPLTEWRGSGERRGLFYANHHRRTIGSFGALWYSLWCSPRNLTSPEGRWRVQPARRYCLLVMSFDGLLTSGQMHYKTIWKAHSMNFSNWKFRSMVQQGIFYGFLKLCPLASEQSDPEYLPV